MTQLVSPITKFFRQPGRRKRAFLEAAIRLSFAQILVSTLPYSWWSHTLGMHVETHSELEQPTSDPTSVQTVVWAIETASRYLPWSPVCLPRAMAMKWMLGRRDVNSVLCIGILMNALKLDKDANLHAWLTVGSDTVSGADADGDFKLIARFRA